ncbi:hypothetical protein [Thalassotalea piscium]|uniref:STAS/SEC14 domain-containing protein n=1 Tax=Thalassotalea piscium TaxID=1230533 RepID=A0A7X0TTI3_9GAMM|nr:hypothetical protein [Thalassotalea piscium]MBB6543287.1 hypothetical protein [Thalassotalea piscium]
MQEHGSFELEIKNKTLLIKAFDSWNVETAIRFFKETRALVCAHKLKNEPWACLVDLTQWELGTPDIWPVVDELNTWANKNNQKYEAVICSSSLQKLMIERSQENLFTVEINFFDTVEQARDWLEQLSLL